MLGVKRGGALLGEIVTEHSPNLRAKFVMVPKVNLEAGLKNTITSLINSGHHRIAIVDAYMGGGFANRIRNILQDLTQQFVRQGKDIQFDVFWMRETFGFEKSSSDKTYGGGITVAKPQGLPAEHANRIRHHHVNVRLVPSDLNS